ncbi:MAG: hypothetical protein JSC188_000483 [Candidatus Tokpelaia sp. JSC188]|nr:MAG: hypothetical protein JSC188_000483 [Candidatus Tokpelaia sp. JSC188]
MKIAIFLRRLAALLSAGIILNFGLVFAEAQGIRNSHLQAAKQVIAAINATNQFDIFLPRTARELKNELMRKDPNLEKIISQTVDEQALALVSRRAELEEEVAGVYAKHFSEDELKQITQFYNSTTGKKLLKEGPLAIADSVGAYDIWRHRISQDLIANVGKVLNDKLLSKANDDTISMETLHKGITE